MFLSRIRGNKHEIFHIPSHLCRNFIGICFWRRRNAIVQSTESVVCKRSELIERPHRHRTASSSAARVSLRLAVAFLFLLAAFYVGRPLYWKLSATIHEVQEKRKSVKEATYKAVKNDAE
ncbi:hypothetical protein OPV22_000918 [Ensete ventricosum]|uniref:Uncharacterized protein n=1 Tax=Ensete ventricosum TaxID=4639 RepID=A0AAV8RK64_ENSVE|nr:hypothetical protein OPV22_000918 [Ensete ventricosum]